ncbi:amino acid--[acyl-carrier-protein] ligase [soil metagenome]
MSAPYATPDDFRTAVLDGGKLTASTVDGVYQLSGEFEDVLQGLHRHIGSHRVDTEAPRRWFPPVIPREQFLQTDYVASFPDLVGSVDVFRGSDHEHKLLLNDLNEGRDWTQALVPSEIMLSSAVCHSLYGTLPHAIPAEGSRGECCGFVFRHESGPDPTRLQAFRMYEFVLVGTPEQALHHRDSWMPRAQAILEGLGLSPRVEVANDPFFGRAGKMLAAGQMEAELKYEFVVDITDVTGTAIASANYQQDHFGRTFSLSTGDGAPAHGACMAFGLERTTLALYAVHGLDVASWPVGVRTALGC